MTICIILNGIKNKPRLWILLLVLSSIIFSSSIYAHPRKITSDNWGYRSKRGPSQWERIPEAATCRNGKQQSPIAIHTGSNGQSRNIEFDGNLNPLVYQWKDSGLSIINNGRTIKIRVEPGSTTVFQGETYHLLEFHFHTPSEHTVDGRHLPLEAHFVHRSSDPQSPKLLVIALLFQKGPDNVLLQKILDQATLSTEPLQDRIHPYEFFSNQNNYLTYTGSLTTPPCTEGVTWIISNERQTVAKSQIDQFEKLIHGKNYRPVQPDYGRVIHVTSY